MTNRYTLLFLFFFTTAFASWSQGVGRLQINADLSSIAAYDPTIEVSVINLSSNKEMVRQSVTEDFRFAFPLNGRYMLYFKKDGYNTTRLMLDTRTFMSGIYTIRFDLNMDRHEEGDNAMSIPIGTIKFDKATTNFAYKASELLAVCPLKVVTSIRESEVVKF